MKKKQASYERKIPMTTLNLIFPVYNEQKRLKKTFTALNSFTPPKEISITKVIFVNDGSIDQSLKILKNTNVKFPKKIISYSQNQGKGFAIKQGLLSTKADYALFLDVDMSTPLSQLKKIIPYIKQNIPVIIGTRKNGHSTVVIAQPWYRQFLGKLYTYLSNIILNTWVTDFTCGFKSLSKSAYTTIAPLMTVNRWGYDSELLFLASCLNFPIQEKALLWYNDKNSRVNLIKDIYRSLSELIQIRLNYIKGVYQLKTSFSVSTFSPISYN